MRKYLLIILSIMFLFVTSPSEIFKTSIGNSLSEDMADNAKVASIILSTPDLLTKAKDDVDNAKVSISVLSPPDPLTEAKGDFSVDDTLAIQACIDYVYGLGGGVVFIPPGHYKTTKSLRVKNNVTLLGSGNASWIDNVTTGGFERCVVITGNISDITSHKSVYDEVQYSLNGISAGGQQVTFTTATDANNFNVGDIIFLQSSEKWSDKFPDSMVGKYQAMNKITSKNGGVLTLEYVILDSYPTAPSNPTICKITGNILGYDGLGGWIAKNAGVKNLRLTHRMDQSSGWYVVFAFGYECVFEDLYMDSASTMFGSNALGYSRIENVTGNFDGGCADFADLQLNNIYRNIKGYRVAVNSNVNRLGFTIHDGADNIIENCEFNFANMGNLSTLYNNRTKVLKNKVYNAVSESLKGCIYGARGDGYICKDNTIKGGKYHGIIFSGNSSVCVNNIINGVNYTKGFYGILVDTITKNSIIKGNTIGTKGSRTNQDIVLQAPTADKSNVIQNNDMYYKQDNYAK